MGPDSKNKKHQSEETKRNLGKQNTAHHTPSNFLLNTYTYLQCMSIYTSLAPVCYGFPSKEVPAFLPYHAHFYSSMPSHVFHFIHSTAPFNLCSYSTMFSTWTSHICVVKMLVTWSPSHIHAHTPCLMNLHNILITCLPCACTLSQIFPFIFLTCINKGLCQDT